VEPLWVGILGLVVLLVFIVVGVHISLSLVAVGLIGVILIAGVGQAFDFLVMTTFHRVFRAEFAILH